MTTPNPDDIILVSLEQAYRLLNHGPTVLVSSAHSGVINVMAAAWSLPRTDTWQNDRGHHEAMTP